MKKVFDNASVAVIFVKQDRPEGRNSNGSIYFEGNVIYSYGSHFPMCKIVGDTALVTNRTYSNTTAKHMNHLHSALRSSFLRVIYVNNPTATSLHEVQQNVSDLLEGIADTEAKAKRSRKYKAELTETANRQTVNLYNYRTYITNIIAAAA